MISKNNKYGCWEYSLNINSPVFKGILQKVAKDELEILLKLIARNIPIADIIDNNDEEPANHDILYAEIDKEDLLAIEKKHTKQLLNILIQSGETKAKAIEDILRIEPFVRHKEELLDFLKR